ncbi:hypothetical protein [Streptomyces oceani]|uniref:Uncharacterized protein n=1 Tax=Streptomyces oceani TaxID=1075402 RepID=A0A1E7JVE1_9ACTN|nr:hypothetical protein [Streptomyces oceani]OEU94384.1 hypothetical protein AN216_24390 [Streptomyces oceani]
MVITDETTDRLRRRASAGDAHASTELARLLSLTASEGTEPESEEPTWPEESWLRAAVTARPDDVTALTLLTGRLAQQTAYWQDILDMNPNILEAYGEDTSSIRRRRTETAELYARLRRFDLPEHTRAGLDELGALLGVRDDTAMEDPYSYYTLEDEAWGGSVCHFARIVTSDADALRWACDRWLVHSEGGLGELTLTTRVAGAEPSLVRLDEHVSGRTVDWSSVTLPELTGTPLPAGLPVPGQHGLYYGFSAGAE